MELLQYTFFQHALIGSLLASIVCGIIGTYIVTRRLVFISGGLTHASFGGIGMGLYTGISPILSAAIFSVLSAFGVDVRNGIGHHLYIPVSRICPRPFRLSVREYPDNNIWRYRLAGRAGDITYLVFFVFPASDNLCSIRPRICPFTRYSCTGF